MTYTVEPFESMANPPSRPYSVKVNGQTLMQAWPRHRHPRRFKDSFSAALAGSRYVDEVLRPASCEPSAGPQR